MFFFSKKRFSASDRALGMLISHMDTRRAVTRANVKIARQCGTISRSTPKSFQKELPIEQGTNGSEQTTSIRYRDPSSPATPQYGLYGSTAAWDAVLLRTFCRMPQNSRDENKKTSNGRQKGLNGKNPPVNGFHCLFSLTS
jgi:hypothetical protein